LRAAHSALNLHRPARAEQDQHLGRQISTILGASAMTLLFGPLIGAFVCVKPAICGTRSLGYFILVAHAVVTAITAAAIWTSRARIARACPSIGPA